MGTTTPAPSDDEFFDDEAFHLSGLSDEEKTLLATLLRSEIDPNEINFNSIDDDEFGTEGSSAPPIDPEFAERLKDRVMKSIQAGDLSAELLRFGTVGLIQACLSLLGPPFSLSSEKEKKKESK